MSSSMTGFGAGWETPARTAAVLRAQASAAGVPLGQVDDLDRVTAVLGAHAWATACDRTTLGDTAGQPEPVIAAAAAVLARAAGHAAAADPLELIGALSAEEPLACPAPLLRHLHPALSWAHTQLLDPAEVACALANAATDLLHATRHPVAAAGWALLAEAEAILLDH